MLRTTLASSRLLRVGVLGLVTFTTAVSDHQRQRGSAPLTAIAIAHTPPTSVARESYSPQFSSIIVDGNSGAMLSVNNPDGSAIPPRSPRS